VCCANRESSAPRRAVVEIFDRRAKVSQRLMLHDLLGSLQRHDVQADSAPLEIKQLV
jgi:hypothetical protein